MNRARTGPLQFQPISQQAPIESKNITDSNEGDLPPSHPTLNRRFAHQKQIGKLRDVQWSGSFPQHF
jgi:hypothetical protein